MTKLNIDKDDLYLKCQNMILKHINELLKTDINTIDISNNEYPNKELIQKIHERNLSHLIREEFIYYIVEISLKTDQDNYEMNNNNLVKYLYNFLKILLERQDVAILTILGIISYWDLNMKKTPFLEDRYGSAGRTYGGYNGCRTRHREKNCGVLRERRCNGSLYQP